MVDLLSLVLLDILTYDFCPLFTGIWSVRVLQVIAFFASKLEKKGPGPYSSMFVLETIEVASKTWPRNSLRVSM